MSVAVLALLPVAIGGVVIIWRRRWPTHLDGEAAERAVRARIEQAAAQERATSMHPDCVRSWMRPH
jgi:hypothetical protein